MTDHRLDRRDLLNTTGAIAIGAGVATQTTTAQSAEGPTVYVGSFSGATDGTLYAVDAATGEEEQDFTQPSSRVESSPTVVANLQDGDSVGSRVRLGTLGHHRNRAEGGIGSGDDSSNGGNGSDGFGPGFKIGGALIRLGSAGYLLKQRLDDEERSEQEPPVVALLLEFRQMEHCAPVVTPRRERVGVELVATTSILVGGYE